MTQAAQPSSLESPPTLPGAAPEAPAYAEVVVPRHLHRSFTYAVPAGLRGRLLVGSRVLVPFGPGMLGGVVVSLATQAPSGDAVRHARRPALERWREIQALLDEAPEPVVSPELLALTRLVSDRYLAPWGQCLRLILPGSAPRTPAPRYVLVEPDRALREGPARLSATAREVLNRLGAAGKGLTLASLKRSVRGPVARTLSALKRHGLVRESGPSTGARRKGPYSRDLRPVSPPPAEQHRGESSLPCFRPPAWWPRLQTGLESAQHGAFLLHAPPADRLTCLLQAAGDTLAQGRSVLVIAPEIARASAIEMLARRRWGDGVALLHGGLPPAARNDAWCRIRSGSARVVVGTRSAVFAPLRALGLICVEDEEDPSLKEEQEPRYHAREVAWMRARQNGAALLIGSAHPSLETLYALDPAGYQGGTVMPDGAHPAGGSPAIQVVDLRRVPFATVLSEPMIAGIGAALQACAQAVLFLNRKGFAPALLCRDCGRAPQCPHCSASLTFYRQAGRLACRHCGTAASLPDACPTCLAARLEPVGFGTERIEAEVRRLFRGARIGRLDRDTGRTPAEVAAIRRQAAAGDLDILIGTQMLFQGEPLPPVGFVGLPHADAGLHLPDFRAAEHTYHALVDAVGMARVGDAGGQVVLQTYLPNHHAMASVVNASPVFFYEQELASRQALGYPPFSHLIQLRVSGGNPVRVQEGARRWAGMLNDAVARERSAVTVLGPVPAALARARGRHRWQILVKAADPDASRRAVQASLEELEGKKGYRGLKFEVDVDPVEML